MDMLLDALNNRVFDLVVTYVPPPQENIGGSQSFLGQPVLGICERRRVNHDVAAQTFGQALGDRAVDALRVNLADLWLGGLVEVLIPDEDINGHAAPSEIL